MWPLMVLTQAPHWPHSSPSPGPVVLAQAGPPQHVAGRWAMGGHESDMLQVSVAGTRQVARCTGQRGAPLLATRCPGMGLPSKAGQVLRLELDFSCISSVDICLVC